MATRTSDRGSDIAPERHGAGIEAWSAGRRLYLDNLKVLLIAAIIAIHGVLGYARTIDEWQYTQVREVTLALPVELVALVLLSPFGFFLMALFFLMAGLVTPPSIRHKGPARFARDRLLRLGIPFAVLVLGVWPVVMYGLEHPLGKAPGSFWAEFLDGGKLDVGPLWFVGTLLVFSLVHAGWVAVRRGRTPHRAPRDLTGRHLALIAVAVAVLSFLVRLVYPFGQASGFANLNFWEWPACAAMYGVGLLASGQGWIAAVPVRLFRVSRLLALCAAAAMAVFLAVGGSLDLLDDAYGGWHWPAMVFAAIESVLTTFGPVWLLGAAQRHLDRRLRWVPASAARSAYAAFLLQGPVLIGLAVAMRPLPVPAEVKAVVVAGGGVAACFALAWLVIRRLPGAARVV